MRGNIGGKGQFGFHIEIVEGFPDSENLPSRLSIQKVCLSFSLFFLYPFHRRGQVLDRKFCLSIYLFIYLFTYLFLRHHFFLLKIFNNLMHHLLPTQYLKVPTSTALYQGCTNRCRAARK